MEDLTKSIQPSKKQTEVNSTRLIGDIDREADVFCMRGEEDYYDSTGFPELGDKSFPRLEDLRFDNGNSHKAEDRDAALAKMITRADWETKRYFIKCGKDNKFVNPLGLDENLYGKRHAGELVYKFCPVNRKAFILYIQFLRTKNQAYIREAEREMA